LQAAFTIVALLPVTLFVFVCGSPIVPSTTVFVSPTPVAVVTVSGFFVTTSFDRSGTFLFKPRFKLTETSGKSGATIQNIRSSMNGIVTNNTGSSCWTTPIRVRPGATLDLFDSGSDRLGHCAPSFAGPADTARITMVVTFTDDEGLSGSVEATTTATGSGFAAR
jgi:hypothetical protein